MHDVGTPLSVPLFDASVNCPRNELRRKYTMPDKMGTLYLVLCHDKILWAC